ncbi:MAG TPA: rhodanese-like domain-containing protein [Stellaceae bacterium]
MLSVMERRHAAVAETIARIRAVEHGKGITGAALDDIKGLVIDLAGRTELFPPEQFAVPDGRQARLYRLAEDPDHRFALYASAGMPGKAQPPHNHTTWAVIAGVYGREHNVFYERTDNRSTPGQGTLRRTGELTVVKGNAVAFRPDDFHTIEVIGAEPSLHLHMYGLSLERLPERINFASASGGPYTIFPANPGISAPEVPPGELKAMLGDGAELAVLDVREEGLFAQGHLLLAASLPLSRLEIRLAALVPRRGTRIVVCDEHGSADGGLAQKAAGRLLDFGYGNVAVLKGGVAGWRAAGHELFSGVYVPSKAFGEFVEHRCDTPRLDAAELKAKLDAGEDVLILDSRPMSEYRVMSIPGGIDCPGAELVYRVHDLVKSPDTLVVVNCAGRTRSIIGAQSLIDAGLPNRVAALKNGTMGWHLAGFALEHGKRRHAPDPSPEGLARAKQAAARVAERFGVRRIDHAALHRFEAERETRSLYLLDVRSPGEYAAGHLPGARSAPGGQLVQATDSYVGTRNARLVLADGGDGVRATMTASWLVQMGWDDVYVLADALLGEPLEVGAERTPVFGLPPRGVAAVAPATLDEMMKEGVAVVVDLASSLDYREAHIPGAWFAVRSRFADSVARLPGSGALVLTSPDGVLARVAAADLAAAAPTRPVHVLAGGTEAWRAAGLPLAGGEENLTDTPDDVWYRPYDRRDGVEAAMQDYLRWEVDLVTQIERDGDARFRTFR